MNHDVEKRIVALRNEVKAQKVARELAYSQLLMPENTPSISYSGTATVQGQERFDTLARCRVRFTRTDGKQGAPFVNFPFSFAFSPTYREFEQSVGNTVTGDDVDFVDEQCYVGYVAGAGPNYVDFYIDVTTEVVLNWTPFTSIDFSFTVEAISNVPGTLSVERIL